ncbi:MAG: hypothetical protein IKS68_03805, partial [Mailhella sp.]|nr:hypothetical protein [Mailhella sp.]
MHRTQVANARTTINSAAIIPHSAEGVKGMVAVLCDLLKNLPGKRGRRQKSNEGSENKTGKAVQKQGKDEILKARGFSYCLSIFSLPVRFIWGIRTLPRTQGIAMRNASELLP